MKKHVCLWTVCLLFFILAVADAQDSIAQSRNNAIIQAVQKVSPSVVNIKTTRLEERQTSIFDDWWSPFFLPRRREVHGLGSGIIIDHSGYILTNQHVIADASKLEVTLPNGREFEATLAGEDYLADVALLKVSARDLPSAVLGDSDDILIGEWAIAIGNPFASFVQDPHPSVTVGVISAADRMLRQEDRFYYGLLQTDAAINPGNSGGPLVNAYGEIIGINTAIFSTSGGSQGLGFAIPINVARQVLKKLRKYGMVLEPVIGLEYQELSPNIAQHLGLSVTAGVIVSQVHEGSLADRAGIKRLDVIQSVSGRNVDTIDEVLSVMRLPDAGDTVAIQVLREGRTQTLRLRVNEMPEVQDIWGVTVVDLKSTSYAPRYRRTGALVVRTHPESLLTEIKMGDLIYGFSKRRRESYPVRTLSDLTSFVRQQRSGDIITIYLERNQRDYYIPNWRVP